ncbi:DNA methyltransferase [bacterium]|nr:DNA methyltransferase [Rubripirellula sp.]MDA7936735.1 DNA methyltransferase [bacterium]
MVHFHHGSLALTLQPNRIYQGNCIEKLRQLEAGSVDLIFADPPFNIGYSYDVYDDQKTTTDYLEFCEAWIREVHTALKPSGTFWLAIGDEYAAELKVLSQQLGFHTRSWVIWYYTFGVNCVRGFSRSHTHLFHFVKDPDDFTFNGENPAVRVASARQLVYADSRASTKGRLPDNTWILRPQDAKAPGFSPSHDTWFFSRVAGTFKEREGFHGCQMPEQLLGRIIRVSSNPGDLVVDPFGGSGTTLAVAKKLGRRWNGFELSKEYVTRIEERVGGCEAGQDLDGPADPQKSAPKTSRGKKRTKFKNGKPVISLDAATESSVIEAFADASDGHSTDYVLCDPNLAKRFLCACRERALPGDARMWNSFLLRIRKSGKLPKSTNPGRRLSYADMDPYSDGSEAAMRLVGIDYGMTLDEMLCSPLAASEFDQLAGLFAPGYSSFEYRWSALALRKRAGTKRYRTLACDQHEHWKQQRTPNRLAIEKCLAAKYDCPGVYVVLHEDSVLYVGETRSLRDRVEKLLNTEAWMKFSPTAVRVWTIDGEQQQFGLRSFLVNRDKPLLNSEYLRQS